MRITPDVPTVNELTGGVVYTILIMKNPDASRPPILRVTPKRLASGLAMHRVFTPVGKVKGARTRAHPSPLPPELTILCPLNRRSHGQGEAPSVAAL